MDLGSLLTQNKPQRIKASSRTLEYRQIEAPNKCKPERSSHIDEDFRTDFPDWLSPIGSELAFANENRLFYSLPFINSIGSEFDARTRY